MQKCLKWPLSNTLASPASQHENMPKWVVLFQDSEQLASDPATVFIPWFWFFFQMKNVTLHCLHLDLKTIKLKQLHKIWSWLSLRESFTFSFQSHAVNKLFFFFKAGMIAYVFIFLKRFERCWFWKLSRNYYVVLWLWEEQIIDLLYLWGFFFNYFVGVLTQMPFSWNR